MIDYKTFNLESYEFIDESGESWKRQLLEILLIPRIALLGSPVKPKEISGRPRGSFIEDLARAIGLINLGLEPILRFHRGRLSFRETIRRIVYQVSVMALAGIVLVGSQALMKIVKPLMISAELGRVLSSIVEIAIIFTFQLLFMFVIFRIAFRLGSTLTNKNFADSLCAIIAVEIVVVLSRDDILTDPRKRKTLVRRIDDLARVTRLLPFRFGTKNEGNQQWLNSHFRQLQQYIVERARWAAAPMSSTLHDLRQDFYQLAVIYVEGSYGRFSWEPKYDLPERSLTWPKRVFRTVPSFLGIVVPLMLMILLIREPSYISSIGVSSNIIALILIAWFLLAIDGALKLGVVAAVVSLAKEIKSLK